VEDLRHYTHIVHWSALSEHLFEAVHEICTQLDALPLPYQAEPTQNNMETNPAVKKPIRKRKREGQSEVLQTGETIMMDLSQAPNYQEH
jgi:hypothetical protein